MKIGLAVIPVLLLHIFEIADSLLNLKPQQNKLSEDGRLSFLGIAAKYGFPAQQENIITEDGYILTLFHIPGDVTRPVLLIHGNTPTSDCWIIRGNTSLAITLAQRGYDVWAINLRGTRYSMRHVYLHPDKQSDKFYDFSFYEQAVYDTPATIDFILQKTGQSQLTAIGHSVGTTQLYVLGAERPEYNDKIKLGISLAPISFLQNLRGIAAVGAALEPELAGIVSLLKTQKLLSYDQLTTIFQAICLEPFGYELCIKIGLFSVLGSDPDGFEPEFQKTLFGHFPGGTTKKSLTHLSQISRNNRFARYDYGFMKNSIVYRRFQPPEFDLRKVRMRSALFMGKNDFLGTVKDAQLLYDALPNVVHYQVLPYKKFNHGDFIWGRHMPDNLYPYLFKVLDKYI